MATLEEILKPDSMSQVSDPKKSNTVAPQVLITSIRIIKRNRISPPACRFFSSSGQNAAAGGRRYVDHPRFVPNHRHLRHRHHHRA